jgi:hypothetical protein
MIYSKPIMLKSVIVIAGTSASKTANWVSSACESSCICDSSTGVEDSTQLHPHDWQLIVSSDIFLFLPPTTFFSFFVVKTINYKEKTDSSYGARVFAHCSVRTKKPVSSIRVL